jgi:hypothetical protein
VGRIASRLGLHNDNAPRSPTTLVASDQSERAKPGLNARRTPAPPSNRLPFIAAVPRANANKPSYFLFRTRLPDADNERHLRAEHELRSTSGGEFLFGAACEWRSAAWMGPVDRNAEVFASSRALACSPEGGTQLE